MSTNLFKQIYEFWVRSFMNVSVAKGFIHIFCLPSFSTILHTFPMSVLCKQSSLHIPVLQCIPLKIWDMLGLNLDLI